VKSNTASGVRRNAKASSRKPKQVNLYEAKTHLSELVERAALGEEIVIAKAGRPKAKIVPIESKAPAVKRVFGNNLLEISYLAPDWDAPMTKEELIAWGVE
jgi:prevent-host-death family protein